jgi:ribokinase
VSARVVVVGSLNADFVLRVPRAPRPGETVVGSSFAQFPGGKGANQAYAAARLGAEVTMIGQVGGDPFGGWLRDSLAAGGVDVSSVGVDPAAPTGVALISIDESGQNQIVIVPGANGSFTPAALRPHEDRLRGAGVVLLQLEIPIDTVVRAAEQAREAGAVVILDPAPARADLPAALLAAADWVTPNETELAILDGRPGATLSRPEATAAARRLCARGARNVVVKLGADGALVLADRGAREQLVPAFPVRAVDTTAAGDAFNAAFAVSLTEGRAPADAAAFAAAAAAVSVTRRGAQPSMPTREEALALLRPGR